MPAVIVTFVMMVHVTLNAVLRKYFGSPIDYTLEITQYWYMPILAFLGFMAAQRRGQHIAADLIFQMLPTVSRRFVLAFFYLVAAVLVAALAKFGWGEAQFAREIGKHAGITPVPAWQPYYLAPLAFGVMTLQFLHAAYTAIRFGVAEESIEEAELNEFIGTDEPTEAKEALR
ncbi:hypothetical protein GCM10009668_28620 [Nocardioides dubius]|uniref:Tripartite ATP-independent periplasmic transporters DctQ component domain-containing protein n=1 Tax=Nocardioides dubius TaxID=317019 RepID=A0ABP4EIS2_9ACTN